MRKFKVGDTAWYKNDDRMFATVLKFKGMRVYLRPSRKSPLIWWRRAGAQWEDVRNLLNLAEMTAMVLMSGEDDL